MPTPPSCAMAIARRDLVTVFIAAETSGILSWMLRVSLVFRPTSRGRTFEWAGTRRTSSKVRAFWTGRIATPKSRIIRRSHLPVNAADVASTARLTGALKLAMVPLSRSKRNTLMIRIALFTFTLLGLATAQAQVYKCVGAGGKETGRYVPQTDLGPRSRSRCSARRQGCKRRAGQERRSQDRGRAGTGVPQAPAGPGKGGQGIRREIRRSAAQTGELPQRAGAARAIRDRRPRGALQRARRALLPR